MFWKLQNGHGVTPLLIFSIVVRRGGYLMLRTWRALLLLLVCFADPFSLHAQRSAGGRSSGGVLDVQVRYANGTPGPRGIHVRLESAEGGPAGDCQTIDGGKCQFSLSSGGVYLVRISERGFKEVMVRVEMINISRGYASLELKPIPGVAPPEKKGETVSVLDLSVPENARQEFEKGQGALNENKLDDGVAHLRKAIQLYDAFPQAYTLLGTAYLGQRDWKHAQLALQRANELDPQFPDAYLELGAVFNQTKEYPQAETALLKGLELKPEAPAGHYELAKTYWALGRWKDAAPHARKAVEGMPDLAPAHALLGNVMLRESNAQGALHEYQEYLRLDPQGSMAPGVRQMIEKIQKSLHP
jgi:Flp pilus assembly protein TadD